MDLKPSDFARVTPWNSVLQLAQAETIARNIMSFLERSGNEWRRLGFDEYCENRLKQNPNFEGTQDIKENFERVVDYCVSADTAILFSPDWKKIRDDKREGQVKAEGNHGSKESR